MPSFAADDTVLTDTPTCGSCRLRRLPPASFLRLQAEARAILLAGAAVPLPQPVARLQRRLRNRVRDELLDTTPAVVLEIAAGPNPRVKIGHTEKLWTRIDQHLREMNRYQYGLVDAHLTERLPDALGRAEAQAHAWMARHYQPVIAEEYAHADYDFAVTCVNAAANLHLTRPI